MALRVINSYIEFCWHEFHSGSMVRPIERRGSIPGPATFGGPAVAQKY